MMTETPEHKPYGNDKQKSPLILAQFSNGNLKCAKESCLKFTCYKKVEKNSCHSKRILVAESSRLQYSGSNYESEMSTISSSVLKVGVRSKRSGKMKLYDIDFFNVKPLLKCQLFKSEEKSSIEKSDDLVRAFGSKAVQKIMKSRFKNEAASEESVQSAVLSMPMEDDQVIKNNVATRPQSSSSSSIPPQNKNATSVDTVYDLFDIISENEYAALELNAKVFLDATHENVVLWRKENTYCEFIIQFVERHLGIVTLHKAKLLCYLHYMMCFLKTCYKDWRSKKDPVPEVPEPYKQKLMNNFALNRSLPQRMKDKMLAYATVLSLMLHEYCYDYTAFASSIKLSAKRITSVAYALGCHVSERKDAHIIELKLPLYKPRSSSKRKK